jgi:hypothetical protein
VTLQGRCPSWSDEGRRRIAERHLVSDPSRRPTPLKQERSGARDARMLRLFREVALEEPIDLLRKVFRSDPTLLSRHPGEIVPVCLV